MYLKQIIISSKVDFVVAHNQRLVLWYICCKCTKRIYQWRKQYRSLSVCNRINTLEAFFIGKRVYTRVDYANKLVFQWSTGFWGISIYENFFSTCEGTSLSTLNISLRYCGYWKKLGQMFNLIRMTAFFGSIDFSFHVNCQFFWFSFFSSCSHDLIAPFVCLNSILLLFIRN